MFRLVGEKRGEVWARNGLGNALAGVGRYDDARTNYMETEKTAARIGYEMVQCFAATNLGRIEYALGDPGAAMGSFAEVIRIHRRIGNIRESIIPNINLAICGAELGSVQAASDSLESMILLCDREGYSDMRAMVEHLNVVLQGAQVRRSLFRRTALRTSPPSAGDAVVGLAGLPWWTRAAGLLDEALAGGSQADQSRRGVRFRHSRTLQ
jgi:tetratricopeptide (TPR) repeat protein